MNTARFRARLATLRAEIDDMERMLEEESANEGEASPWMKIRDYASYAKVSTYTVRQWIEKGLREAGAAVGHGHLTRVHRDRADAWRKGQ